MPNSCNECKFDLRTDICQAFCEWNAEHPYSIRATDRLPDCPLLEVPEPCKDAVSRQEAIDEYKAVEKLKQIQPSLEMLLSKEYGDALRVVINALDPQKEGGEP